MGILEKIKEIEFEMSRTQKNKATEYHLGRLKCKLAKLRTQLLEGPKVHGPPALAAGQRSPARTTREDLPNLATASK